MRSERDLDVGPERSPTSDVGRASRSQDLPFASPPLFEDEPAWEAIAPETEEVEAEDPATLAALEGPEADDDLAPTARAAAPSTAADDDDGDDDDDRGLEPRAAFAARPSDAVMVGARAGDAPGRHEAPHERKVRKATGHDAKRDRYNDPDVVANERARGNPHQISRPGLRVKNRDEFHLRGEYAYRYQIVSGNKAVPVDKIWEKELQHGRSEDGQRLALNPSAPRRLVIGGVGGWCVMSWAGEQSAAWIAIKDLKGKFADIKGKASTMSKRWNPKDAGKAKRDGAKEMKFRAVGDPLTKKDRIDETHYIIPAQQGKDGNEVGDYLAKDVLRRSKPGVTGRAASESKRLERAAGNKPLALPGGERDVISIVGNLPHDRTPPVAIDVAQPGVDSFFVPKGKTFRREISLYKRYKTKSTLRQTWVFGYVGKDQGNRKVADKARRGWVPLRTLSA
jgi:hypothetical protein